jgi:hypothetical protein
MRPRVPAIGAIILVACSSSSSERKPNEGAAALDNADCDASASSVSFDGDGGATTSGYGGECADAGPRGAFDHSVLGADCSASVQCPKGKQCWDFRLIDQSLSSASCIDASIQPCTLVTCPPGKQCFQLAPVVPQVVCEY